MATTYADTATLRTRLNLAPPTVPPPSPDPLETLLQALLNQAAAFLDKATRHPPEGVEAFVATTGTTRTFPDSVTGWIVVDDLLSVTLVTRGGVVVPSTAYTLMPFNQTPHLGLLFGPAAPPMILPVTVPYYSGFAGVTVAQAAEARVAITGTWGYSATVPGVITGLCLTLAERLYERTGHQPADPLSGLPAPETVLDSYLSQQIRQYRRDTDDEATPC